MSLSHFDLCLCSETAARPVSDITYALRGISDHSPLIIDLKVCPLSTLNRAPWKLNAFWLNLITSTPQFIQDNANFWEKQVGDQDVGMRWEMFKAYLRGLFIREINVFKKKSSAQSKGVERLVDDLETQFIADPNEECREAWLLAQEALNRLTSSTVERKCFFSKLAFYEEGEHTGRLLAKIYRAQQASPSIDALRAPDGKTTNSPDNIMAIHKSFYLDLYRSRQVYTEITLLDYLEGIELPVLSETDYQLLDAPLAELQSATAMFPNSKAPGEDGIPIEVYRNYGEYLLPRLLEVFNKAKMSGCLPLSTVCPKP